MGPRKPPFKLHIRLGQVCVSDTSCRRIPYSPNKLGGMHHMAIHRWKKAWEQEVWGRWMEKRGEYLDYAFPVDFKVRIQIFFFTCTFQDSDNAVASCKGIIDGLVQAGVIKNDSYKEVFTDPVTFVKVAKREAEHVEVVLIKYKV